MPLNSKNHAFFDFSDLLPDDNFFFGSFSQRCIENGYGSALIDWGASFPWTIDEKLSLFPHLDEKTVTAFGSRNSGAEIIPVIPFAGGMEFILSFPSYTHLRFKDSVSVINPETPGAMLLIESIIDDYLSLLSGRTKSLAINMSMPTFFDNCPKTGAAAEMVVSLVRKYSDIRQFFLLGKEKDSKLLKNMAVAAGSGCRVCIVTEKNADMQTYQFFLDEKEMETVGLLEKYISDAWKLIRALKKQLFNNKFRSSVFYYRLSSVAGNHESLVDIFSKIVKTSDIIKERLNGILNISTIERLFDSDIAVIKTELHQIENDIDNIKSGINGG